MQAVIMAGGKGTRLQSVSRDIPKSMMLICKKPILEYQIESLKKSGIYDITIVVGYLGKLIKDYFNDGSKWNVHITYITETTPLGTAGALYYLKGTITDDFVLLFGDLILDVDWTRFMRFHKEKNSYITLFGHPNSHPYDSDVIVVDKENRVLCIDSKNNERDYYYHNFVNAGIYCVRPSVLDLIKQPKKIDFEKNLVATEIQNDLVYAYRSTEYVKDMGTPERLNLVSKDVKNGIVNIRNLKNKQKAVFLDRDGTINVLRGFINNPENFEFLPGVAEAIRMINESEYLCILATNQPVIARGECSFDTLDKIHAKMETELGKNGCYLDDIYFCPHHPNKGFKGEIPELKIHCNCRKPEIGMITQAASKYNIDLNKSYYIGDSTVDVQTGINAGMKTILLRTGEAGKDHKYKVRPNFISESLFESIKMLSLSNSKPGE